MLCRAPSLSLLPISDPVKSLDECFFFNSFVVRLPYSSIFWHLWWWCCFLKLVVILLLVVCLPTPPSWPEAEIDFWILLSSDRDCVLFILFYLPCGLGFPSSFQLLMLFLRALFMNSWTILPLGMQWQHWWEPWGKVLKYLAYQRAPWGFSFMRHQGKIILCLSSHLFLAAFKPSRCLCLLFPQPFCLTWGP